MSIVKKIVQIIIKLFLSIIDILKYIKNIILRQEEKRIGELNYIQPTAVVTDNGGIGNTGGNFNHGNIHQEQQQPNTWNNWTDETFGVESKIEEYRRKQQDALKKKNSVEKSSEPDYFNDLRPKIKSAKRLDINQGERNSSQPRKNLFEFNENDVHIPQMNDTELGELDFDSGTNSGNAWDADIDLKEVDHVFRQQKQKEREERQKQRLLEHEKRIHQKKIKL